MFLLFVVLLLSICFEWGITILNGILKRIFTFQHFSFHLWIRVFTLELGLVLSFVIFWWAILIRLSTLGEWLYFYLFSFLYCRFQHNLPFWIKMILKRSCWFVYFSSDYFNFIFFLVTKKLLIGIITMMRTNFLKVFGMDHVSLVR